MKKRKEIIIATGILFLCCVAGVYGKYVESLSKIYLKTSFSKDTYKLGEIALMNIQITNNNSEVVYLSGESIDTLKIKISLGNDNNYKDYYGNSRNFVVDGDYYVKINPNETINKQKPILWNFKSNVSGLNSDGTKSVLEDRITTDYAFSETGTYFVKVLLTLKGEESVVIESEPIQIIIEKPNGEDLEVWNKLKDNGEIAYFIQEGDILIPSYKKEARAKVQQEIENLLKKYPNSFYATALRQSLDKFLASEAKKQESLEKLQNQKEKP
jgi:hypothetical protein